MAGRIRTVKPELLEDERTASLSDAAFRLFIGSILLADDYGNLRASPLYLAGAVGSCCGWDAKRSTVALAELVAANLVQPYTVRGQAYGHIRGWEKHQRVDKPGKPRCPNPVEASDVGVIPESFANDSGLTSDLRPPIPTSDPDLLLSPSGDQPALLVMPERPPTFDLLAIYKRHPRHEGKGKGLAKLKAQIRTAADYEALCRAQAAYLASKPVADGFVRHFDTWVNSWRDHLEQPHVTAVASRTYNGRG